PVNQLSSALQSRDGYLWFSTFDGLVRFDGVRFSVFNSGNSPDLPTNRLTGLWEDAMGRLWIQSEQGHLIERSGAAFVDHTSAVGGGPVTTVHVDSVDVWAGTPSGIYRLADTTFVPLHHGQIDGVVLSVFVDSRDDLWIGTSDGGLYLASARGMEPPVQIEGLGSNDVHSLSESPDGSLWIAGHLGSFTLEIEDLGQDPPRPLPPYPPGLTIPTSFHFPEDGPVWVQAWGGMWALVDGAWKAPRDGPGGRLDPVIGVPGPDGRRWAYDPYRVYVDGEELFVSERRLERIQFDHEGTVWASGEGLHMFRPAVVDQRGGRDGLVDNVYVIHEDRQGRIWFGSMGGGLVRLDAEGVHRYPTGPPSGLSNIAMAVHQDRRGDVWVGLWDGGVCRLDGDACAENGIDRLGGRIVRGVHEDRTGSLWFGTDDGVAVRGPEGEWRHLGTADGLPHADVRTFAEDRAGRVWMGTYGGGVVRWNGEVLETPGFELSSVVIRSLYMGVDGVLWVGTEGRGLNRVVPADRTDIQGSPEGGLTHAVGPTGRPATETVRSPDRPTTDDERPPARRMLDASVTVYRVADGLFDEGIHQIVEDDFARLWMSSNRGIFRVAKEDLTDFAEGRS
ncbi:MAG: two-component regulator propeller domain-containing protein, partial [Rhodothermales bacterium]